MVRSVADRTFQPRRTDLAQAEAGLAELAALREQIAAVAEGGGGEQEEEALRARLALDTGLYRDAVAQLKELSLSNTQITDAGCAHLASSLKSGALPALERLFLADIPASDAARAAVYEARANLMGEDWEP